MKNLKAKNNKGITLVALIITVIILLILAVVAIGAVQEDGIIGKAKYARDDYGKAQDKENSILQGYLDKLNDNTLYGNGGTGNTGNGNANQGNGNNGGSNSGENNNNPGNNDGYEEENNEIIESESGAERGVKVAGSNATFTQTINGENYTAIIPVGFCVVKDIAGDSNSITRGLVISDVEDDDLANSKGGNQFVWIPVEDYSKFHLIEGYWNGSLDSRLSDETDYSREAGDSENVGSPMAKNNVAGTAESIAMYTSVEANKGFYIARFEAGNPGTTSIDGSEKPLSQKGVDVWNRIPWGGTSDNIASDGLQGNDDADGAVKVARSMYSLNSECGVTSTLCYGVQWDAVMNFIDSNYYKQDGTLTSFVADSDGKGNYSRNLALTGYYEQNHIFDLAGNVIEWTMEAFGTRLRVYRGGDYYSVGSSGPASYRLGDNPDLSVYNLRFPCGFIFVALSAVKTKI